MGPCKQDTKQRETGAEFHYRLLVVFTPELCISQKLVHVLGIYAMLSFADVSGMEQLRQTHSKCQVSTSNKVPSEGRVSC